MTKTELEDLTKTGEEFEIYGKKGIYKMIDGNIHIRICEVTWVYANLGIVEILESKLIRKPWKPKVGETYWFWSYSPIEKWFVYEDGMLFEADSVDLVLIAFGNCFRTKEECEAHPEIRDRLMEMKKEYTE